MSFGQQDGPIEARFEVQTCSPWTRFQVRDTSTGCCLSHLDPMAPAQTHLDPMAPAQTEQELAQLPGLAAAPRSKKRGRTLASDRGVHSWRTAARRQPTAAQKEAQAAIEAEDHWEESAVEQAGPSESAVGQAGPWKTAAEQAGPWETAVGQEHWAAQN